MQNFTMVSPLIMELIEFFMFSVLCISGLTSEVSWYNDIINYDVINFMQIFFHM